MGAVLPVAMLASVSPGFTPPSTTKPVGAGPVAGGVKRRVRVLPTIDEANRSVGGWGVVTAACVTVIVFSATTSVPVLAEAPAFGAAVNVTVPFADPPAGALIAIHGVVVVAVHGVPG